jgi:hypothetical protein
MDWLGFSAAAVAVVIVACVIVKLRLKKRLDSIDGLGNVYCGGGENDIASAGDDATKNRK